MSIYILIAGVLIALGLLAYYLSDTLRGWVQSVRWRWFKDSEVNFLADVMWIPGALMLLMDNPAFTAWLEQWLGISPGTLMIFGMMIRAAKASRNWGGLPMTKTEDDARA